MALQTLYVETVGVDFNQTTLTAFCSKVFDELHNNVFKPALLKCPLVTENESGMLLITHTGGTMTFSTQASSNSTYAQKILKSNAAFSFIFEVWIDNKNYNAEERKFFITINYYTGNGFQIINRGNGISSNYYVDFWWTVGQTIVLSAYSFYNSSSQYHTFTHDMPTDYTIYWVTPPKYLLNNQSKVVVSKLYIGTDELQGGYFFHFTQGSSVSNEVMVDGKTYTKARSGEYWETI